MASNSNCVQHTIAETVAAAVAAATQCLRRHKYASQAAGPTVLPEAKSAKTTNNGHTNTINRHIYIEEIASAAGKIQLPK